MQVTDMSKKDNLGDFLTDIADAIREKKGTTEAINAQNFSEEIRSIESGGGEAIYDFGEAMTDTSGLGARAIKHLVVADGVTAIGNYAYNNFYLTSVTLPSSIKSIGNGSFNANNGYTELIIPDGVESIGVQAFYANQAKEIRLPASLKTLGNSAFESCQINTGVRVPPSLMAIPNNAWAYARKIKWFWFGDHTSVPTLGNIAAVNYSIGPIYVPDSLYDAWIAATNWSGVASKIAKASTFTE